MRKVKLTVTLVEKEERKHWEKKYDQYSTYQVFSIFNNMI